MSVHPAAQTHRIQVDIAAEGAHVEDNAVVDQIHGEPDAEEADGDAPQVAGAEQVGEVLGAALLRRRRQLVVGGQLPAVEFGGRLNYPSHLVDPALDQQPARRFRHHEPAGYGAPI